MESLIHFMYLCNIRQSQNWTFFSQIQVSLFNALYNGNSVADFLKNKLYCRLKLGTICWECVTCFKEFPWLSKDLLSVQYIDKSVSGLTLWQLHCVFLTKNCHALKQFPCSIIDLGSWWLIKVLESNWVSQCSYLIVLWLKMTYCLSFNFWKLLKTLPWRAIIPCKDFFKGRGGREKRNRKSVWQEHLRKIIDFCTMIL